MQSQKISKQVQVTIPVHQNQRDCLICFISYQHWFCSFFLGIQWISIQSLQEFQVKIRKGNPCLNKFLTQIPAHNHVPQDIVSVRSPQESRGIKMSYKRSFPIKASYFSSPESCSAPRETQKYSQEFLNKTSKPSRRNYCSKTHSSPSSWFSFSR